MSAAPVLPVLSVDLRLVLHATLSDSFEMSRVLLARAAFDGTLQLLTSGWERVLGYGRQELNSKTLLQLLWSNRRNTSAAAAAILDRINLGPVDLRLRCRNGLGKRFRLHRQYDEREHTMYIVAEEAPPNAGGFRRRDEERRSARREP